MVSSFLSSNFVIQLHRFITADKAVGAGGFKATWTEIRDPDPLPVPSSSSSPPAQPCDLFKCTSNNYCISPKLKCNGVHNCGKFDDSDEANCRVGSTFEGYIHAQWFLMLSCAMTVCTLIFLVLSCRRRKMDKTTARLQTSANSWEEEDLEGDLEREIEYPPYPIPIPPSPGHPHAHMIDTDQCLHTCTDQHNTLNRVHKQCWHVWVVSND